MGSNNDKSITRNEMIIIYKIKNKNRIRIFGKNFVKNNKKKCKIIINNKEYDLIEFADVNKSE